MNCDVLNGTVANDVISFSYDTLMLYGINEIADIEIGFDIKCRLQQHLFQLSANTHLCVSGA